MKAFKTKILTALILISGAVAFQSCKDDASDEPNTSTGKLSDASKAKLYDKVWYPTLASGGVNFEFITGGVCRFNKSLDGTWKWQNNGDTMNVSDWTGQRYNMLFESVGDHQMSYRSNQAGNNYKDVYTMKDTE